MSHWLPLAFCLAFSELLVKGDSRARLSYSSSPAGDARLEQIRHRSWSKHVPRRGLPPAQPSPTSVLVSLAAQDRAELDRIRWQPSAARLSAVSISANPSEGSRSSDVSLFRTGTHGSRSAGALPESQPRIRLGGLQRHPGSILQEKGFASSTPGENLSLHLHVHRPCSFSSYEWLHFCCTVRMAYKALRTKSL